jgi:hypothetical protein
MRGRLREASVDDKAATPASLDDRRCSRESDGASMEWTR